MASRMFRHQNKSDEKIIRSYARCDMIISGQRRRALDHPLGAKDVDNIRKMEKQYMRS
jgi:hypothetical protein